MAAKLVGDLCVAVEGRGVGDDVRVLAVTIHRSIQRHGLFRVSFVLIIISFCHVINDCNVILSV